MNVFVGCEGMNRDGGIVTIINYLQGLKDYLVRTNVTEFASVRSTKLAVELALWKIDKEIADNIAAGGNGWITGEIDGKPVRYWDKTINALRGLVGYMLEQLDELQRRERYRDSLEAEITGRVTADLRNSAQYQAAANPALRLPAPQDSLRTGPTKRQRE